MEWMDIYDLDRRLTGRKQLRGAPVLPGDSLTVVHLCIRNAAGQLLIQQRQSTKRSWPDLWDLSVGGAVQAGESSRAAAEREALEELGLRVDLTGMRPILTAAFGDGFDDLYLLRRELDVAALTLQPSEVRAARWATREETLALLENRQFVPYVPAFLELLFQLEGNTGLLREK